MPVTWNAETAAHLLRRAGFGATPREIERAVRKGLDDTLESLFKPDRRKDKLPKGVGDLGRLQGWWLDRMLRTKSPLTEKLTLLWHNHFATGMAKVDDVRLMHLQNRTLRRGALGSFRDLVLDVSRDPAMLHWLDNELNVASDPNENFARELMELFTTGVRDKHGNAAYTERDVEAGARAFTGWTRDYDVFFFDEENHDFGEKTFRGITGDLDGVDVVENLVTDPATARRVAWRLFRFFARDVDLADPVLDEFEQAYLDHDTELRPVVERLFRSDVFYAPETMQAHVKSPVEFVVGAMRMLGAKAKKRNLYQLGDLVGSLGQQLFNPPSVFGWPEGTAWVDAQGLLARAEAAVRIASGRGSKYEPVLLNPKRLLGPRKKWKKLDEAAVVSAVVENLGPVQARPSTRTAIEEYLRTEEEGEEEFVVNRFAVDRKVRGAIALALSAPEFQVS